MNAPNISDWPKIQDEAFTIFRKLLTLDTSNPPGNEALVVNYVRQLLEAEGLQPVTVEDVPGRPNLVLRIPGNGTGPSLMLDSHADVVPTTGQDWSVPPFAGEVKDGCVWGRGAVDMKHMTAMSVAVALTVSRYKIPLKGDLVVTVTADEECGSRHGAFFLVEKHADLIRTDYALGEVGGMNIFVGEKRIYPVQCAEKGIAWLKLTLKGKGGHGSVPRKGTVPAKLTRLLQELSRISFPIQPHPAVQAFLGHLAAASGFPNAMVLKLIRSGKGASLLLDKLVPEDRSAPIRAMLSHTMQPTVIECGTKTNVVPSRAVVKLDCRVLPGTSPEQFAKEMGQRLEGLAEVTLESGLRGNAVSFENPLFDTISKVVSRTDPGAVVSPYLTPGFTNGGAYAHLGIKYMGFTPVMFPPTLVFNSLFHAADERCPVDGFKWGVRTLYEVVADFVGA